MHSFLNKFVTTAPQSAWGQQQQQSSVQVAQPELGQNIPPGTYPPGTLINVGQHITTIESYLAEGMRYQLESWANGARYVVGKATHYKE